MEHHFVVRRLLGGAKGTGLKGDELKYSTSMTMADLKQGLEDGIAEIEQNRSVKFEIKPLLLEGLSVVAWVQDDSNKRVLGSVIVPVEGSGESKRRSSPAAVQKVEPLLRRLRQPLPWKPAAVDLPKSETPKSETPRPRQQNSIHRKQRRPNRKLPRHRHLLSQIPPASSESSRE